jgi:MFS family permease
VAVAEGSDRHEGTREAAQPALFDREHRSITFGVIAAMTLIAFEGISVGTVMPVVARDLDGLGAYAWGFNAYVVTSLLGMVVAGTWSDRLGPGRPMVIGGGLFGLGAAVAALSPTMAVLVAGRAVQGLGSGALIVAIYVVIARGFEESIRPRAFSLLATAWVVPSLVGPFVAGWLADEVSWRAVFWLVPVVVLLPAVVLLPRLHRYEGGDPAAGGRPGRTRAALVAVVGLVLVQDGLARVGGGAASPAVGVAESVTGSVLLVVSLRHLLPPGALRLARGLPTSVMMRGFMAGGFFAAEVFVPLALISFRGVSTTTAGLVLTAAAFGWVTGSVGQGRLAGDRDRARFVQAGAALAAFGVLTLPLSLVAALPFWLASVSWFVGSVGMGLSFPSIAVQTLRLSPDEDQGVNSSALQVSDSVFCVLSVGIAGAVQAAAVAGGGATKGTYVGIWVGAGLFLLLAAVAAARMRPAPASL